MATDPAVIRDSGLDNQIAAHEWGHYLSNRLVGDAVGLSNLQGLGMGEGWGDFCALLLTVRPEDASLPGIPNFSGAYPLGSYSMDSSVRPDNAYYFAVRRYPYSTDFGKNPLTFRHIQAGVPLPSGPPVQGPTDGSSNPETHSTGEVWCSMLWECYAELLRDTGRLTFTQARDRMRQYLVAGLKLTPNAPTFVEARDAILAAALANDAADHAAFCAAFARRGLGSVAIAPERHAANNLGAIESFTCGGIQILSATVDPEYQACDADGVTDVGERGRVVVRFRNAGSTALANISVGVTCPSPNVSYPFGAMKPVANLAVAQLDSVSVIYAVTGNSGIENVAFTPRASDPFQGLHDGLPVSAVINRDTAGTGLTTFNDLGPWTNVGWQQLDYGEPVDWTVASTDAMGPREDRLTSPSFVPSTNAVSIRLSHWHWYQHTTEPPVYPDGMVVELSTDDGATWSDIGASAVSNGYEGTLAATLNPLAGRPAFVGYVGTLDWIETIFQPVGAFAGQTCRLRFRSGFDETQAGQVYGAELTELEFILAPGSTFPFTTFVPEVGTCSPLDVASTSSGTLSFALRGANPVRGAASFVFDLPRASPVTLEVFDVSGRRVSQLVDRVMEPGVHEARWVTPAAPGIYFARLRAMGETLRVRAVITR